MLEIPLIYLKDKMAHIYRRGALTLLGKPVELAKEWKKKGIKLIHIIDLDAKNGSSTNFDVYDALSYVINVQVEGATNEKIVKKLLSIGTRVVVELPTAIDLKNFEGSKKLLVGRISSVADLSQFQDVILAEESKEILEAAKDKRVIVYGKKERKFKVFGYISMLK